MRPLEIEAIRRRPDGSIETETYLRHAHLLRARSFRAVLGRISRRLPKRAR